MNFKSIFPIFIVAFIAYTNMHAMDHNKISSLVFNNNLNKLKNLIGETLSPAYYVALQNAVIYEADEILTWLLSLKPDLNKISDHYWGDTLLHKAAMSGNITIAKKLLDNGASVNNKNAHGNVPLVRAITYNNIPFIKLFMEYGADPFITNNNHETVFERAQDNGNNPEIMALLHEHPKREMQRRIVNLANRLNAQQNPQSLLALKRDTKESK